MSVNNNSGPNKAYKPHNQEVKNKKPSKNELGHISAGKLARNVLNGKKTPEGKIQTTSIGTLKVKKLSEAIKNKKAELITHEGKVSKARTKISHFFQKINNTLRAGRSVTNLELLQMAKKSLPKETKQEKQIAILNSMAYEAKADASRVEPKTNRMTLQKTDQEGEYLLRIKTGVPLQIFSNKISVSPEGEILLHRDPRHPEPVLSRGELVNLVSKNFGGSIECQTPRYYPTDSRIGEKVIEQLKKASIGQPIPIESVPGLYVAKGEIQIPKFAGKGVAINSAHEKLHGKGTSGTNRALYEASDPVEWDRLAGNILGRGLFRRGMEVGEVIQGPKLNGDDNFTVLHVKAPKLKSKPTSSDLAEYKEQVVGAYKNAFKKAKKSGANFVQAPLLSTQAFAKTIDHSILKEWTAMVRSAFIEAAFEYAEKGKFDICMLEFEPGDPGSVGNMEKLATGKEMVAFYKDGPTACLGNFFNVPGGFKMLGYSTNMHSGHRGQLYTYHNVEAALHHEKWMHAYYEGLMAARYDSPYSKKIGSLVKELLNDTLLVDLNNAKKGTDALRIGRELEKKYPDLLQHSAEAWHNGVKQQIVWDALREKFSKSPFKELLAATGNAYLLEHKAAVKAHDNYWSDGGDGKGVNALGKMLMAIRAGETELPDLVINPNEPGYQDDEVLKHATNATTEKLGYSIYGK